MSTDVELEHESSPDAGECRTPYIPWKSFDNFVATLKSTHAPDVIDGGVMPATMSGGLQRQIRAALKFLGLTNGTGKVSDRFNDLIEAHGTPQWSIAVKECVLDSYSTIVGDLVIEKATAGQLDAKFKATGASGQVLDKAIRFYLHALKAAGIKYSSYLSMRKQSKVRKVKTDNQTRVPTSTQVAPVSKVDDDVRGVIEFPLHFGSKPTGRICVPENVDDHDMPLFDAMVAAVKAYAARNAAKVENNS